MERRISNEHHHTGNHGLLETHETGPRRSHCSDSKLSRRNETALRPETKQGKRISNWRSCLVRRNKHPWQPCNQETLTPKIWTFHSLGKNRTRSVSTETSRRMGDTRCIQRSTSNAASEATLSDPTKADSTSTWYNQRRRRIWGWRNPRTSATRKRDAIFSSLERVWRRRRHLDRRITITTCKRANTGIQK